MFSRRPCRFVVRQFRSMDRAGRLGFQLVYLFGLRIREQARSFRCMGCFFFPLQEQGSNGFIPMYNYNIINRKGRMRNADMFESKTWKRIRGVPFSSCHIHRRPIWP
jgi:hypothetical protein